jgi:hypothetical protein
MHTRYISHKRSVHKESKCITCHSAPGFIGEMKGHLNGAKYVYYTLLGYRSFEVLHAKVEDASCLTCHDTGDIDRAIEARKLKTYFSKHRYHIEHEYATCTNCHEDMMHVRMKGFVEYDPKASCINCHDQAELDFDEIDVTKVIDF